MQLSGFPIEIVYQSLNKSLRKVFRLKIHLLCCLTREGEELNFKLMNIGIFSLILS